MFTYTDVWPRNALLRLLARLTGGPFRNTQKYSEEVEEYLSGGASEITSVGR